MKVIGAGASYTVGAATIGFTYAHTLLRNSRYFVVNGFPGAGSGGDFTMDSYELMTSYRLNPALSVGAAYIYNIGKADYQGLRPKFHQINLGASYSLSKERSCMACLSSRRRRAMASRRCAPPAP